MVAVMDRLTDKPVWFVHVFDDTIVARWREELRRDRFIANPRLMKDKTWSWCIQELRDKAIYYKEHQHIRVLDTGSCACKADSAELQSLSADLQRAVVPLACQYKTYQERRERLGKSNMMNWVGQDADDGADSDTDAASDERSVPETQTPGDEHDAAREGRTVSNGASATEESEAANRISAGAQQTVQDEHLVEGHDTTCHPNSVQDESEDDSSDNQFDRDKLLRDFLAEMEQSVLDDSDTDYDAENEWREHLATLRGYSWSWNSPTQAPNIAGSAHMISALVDPRLFPLCYDKTLVFQHGGTVALNNVLAPHNAAQTAPRWTPKQSKQSGKPNLASQDAAEYGPWSRRYQSLPCEVAFVAGCEGHNDTDVEITSYINGLHPDHKDMYQIIEQVLSRCIKPWNDCLVRGNSGLRTWHNSGELGPVPARIITYGVEWDNEMPEWATEFRVLTESQKKSFVEGIEWFQNRPGGSRKRKWEEVYLLSKVEDRQPPPRDSHLWQLAKEYLARPEMQPDADESSNEITTHTEPAAVPEDWDICASRTWDLLYQKVTRLLCLKHPEPGTAFSYQDWKVGCHGSRPIVERGILKRNPKRRVPDLIAPPYKPYSVALQDQFRDQGLQVLVEISSIELTPETPAYAPDAAARAEAYDEWSAKRFAEVISTNEFILFGEAPDEDGWELAGQLNEHIVAIAVFPFDADNVTEPRIAFRQRISSACDLYRLHEWRNEPNSASGFYQASHDGPARFMGKFHDATALAEIFGVSWEVIEPEPTGYYEHQQIGSVATPQGRLVTFPNVLEHRIEPFKLVDGTTPGRYRWLTLYLVDPHYRVCSTRNVPPQQHDWWVAAVGRDLAAAGLPWEIIDHIMRYTNSWPMGMDEAEWHRDRMFKEAAENETWRR